MSGIVNKIIAWLKKLFGVSTVEIPTAAFPYEQYGMNIQDIDQTTENILRALKGSGPWLRFTVPTDEAAEENWYRLDPFLSRVKEAKADYPGLKLLIILTKYSGYAPGAESDIHAGRRLYQSLSNEEAHNRYYNLAYRLAKKLEAEGFADAIIECWNEPDHTVFGIKLDLGEEFVTRLTYLAKGFAAGVKASGVCQCAFPSFMSMNDSRWSYIEKLWKNCGGLFDYFNVHYYDDEPEECYKWAAKVAALTGDKPALITEHGDQHNIEDIAILRGQAWAFKLTFKERLKAVLGYVWCSDDAGWAIADDAARLWNVTHDQNPF